MDASPLLFTLLSSSPVNVQLHGPLAYEGVGVASLLDMNPCRLTAVGREEVEQLETIVQRDAGLGVNNGAIWSATLYPSKPVEAVDVQPFVRPLRGNTHLFSMVGELPDIGNAERFPVGDHWPISCTDQERAFCLLQERMRKLWQRTRPDHEMRLALVADYAGRLETLGAHNFIYWDGELMFAYTSLEGGIEPLAYQVFSGGEVHLEGALPVRISAEEGSDMVVIASRSLLPASTPISAGSVVCFSGGRYVDCCDPVILWNT